jgi:ubiquinone/menaquinone biosynthesis C-methylase UbiE
MKLAQIFDNAKLYEIFQTTVLRKKTKTVIRDEIVRPEKVVKVLDFGCGIGYHSELFMSSYYLGVEPLKACIDTANRKYANSRVEFELGDHKSLEVLPAGSFDLVIAIGVLHHIDDNILKEFVTEAFRILTPQGKLTTFDPVFHDKQSKISKWVVKQDRGRFVRSEIEYTREIRSTFSGIVETRVYSNLLRIPYDHLVINAIKGTN